MHERLWHVLIFGNANRFGKVCGLGMYAGFGRYRNLDKQQILDRGFGGLMLYRQRGLEIERVDHDDVW